jgi:hypothetical protein
MAGCLLEPNRQVLTPGGIAALKDVIVAGFGLSELANSLFREPRKAAVVEHMSILEGRSFTTRLRKLTLTALIYPKLFPCLE